MLGDVIKKITNKLGFETCEACEKRRKELNFAFPWLKYRFARKINKKDVSDILYYKSIVYLLRYSEKMHICKIYAETFNIEYYEPDLDYISPFVTMLERLEKVIKLQENGRTKRK